MLARLSLEARAIRQSPQDLLVCVPSPFLLSEATNNVSVCKGTAVPALNRRAYSWGNIRLGLGRRLFKIEQSLPQPSAIVRKTMARTAPVLYSVDLSECAAIRQLTTQEISEEFAAVL